LHEHAHNADRRVMPLRRSSHRGSLLRQALSFGIINALSPARSFGVSPAPSMLGDRKG
jgi:hypothetical protein